MRQSKFLKNGIDDGYRWVKLLNFLNYIVWLRITDEGSEKAHMVNLMRLKWWSHLSRSFFLYSWPVQDNVQHA